MNEGVALVNLAPKNFRRLIRCGVIKGHKKEDRWLINRDQLMDVANKRGWI